MDGAKILQVVQIYREYFIKNGIVPIDFPRNKKPSSREEKLGHCYGMLDKIDAFVAERKLVVKRKGIIGFVQRVLAKMRMGKPKRWLGFIQGCLWAENCYTVDDMANHNRPDDEKRRNR